MKAPAQGNVAFIITIATAFCFFESISFAYLTPVRSDPTAFRQAKALASLCETDCGDCAFDLGLAVHNLLKADNVAVSVVPGLSVRNDSVGIVLPVSEIGALNQLAVPTVKLGTAANQLLLGITINLAGAGQDIMLTDGVHCSTEECNFHTTGSDLIHELGHADWRRQNGYVIIGDGTGKGVIDLLPTGPSETEAFQWENAYRRQTKSTRLYTADRWDFPICQVRYWSTACTAALGDYYSTMVMCSNDSDGSCTYYEDLIVGPQNTNDYCLSSYRQCGQCLYPHTF